MTKYKRLLSGEELEKRNTFAKKTVVRDERNFYGIFYHRHSSAIVQCSMWFKKKKGETTIIKTTEIPYGGIYKTVGCYIDAPRFLQIDDIIYKRNWRADDVYKDIRKLAVNDNLIFINPTEYLKNTLAGVPGVVEDGVYSFEGEQENYEDTCQDLISCEKIIDKSGKLNWGEVLVKSSLVLVAKKLCNYLLCDNYLVHNFLTTSKMNGII
jgi:hypothetical protein